MEEEKKQRIVTNGEIFAMLDRKKEAEKKYTYKVSYGSLDSTSDYRFNINEAMKNNLTRLSR